MPIFCYVEVSTQLLWTTNLLLQLIPFEVGFQNKFNQETNHQKSTIVKVIYQGLK